MSPRVVLLAGLAVLSAGCLVQPGDGPGEPNVDTESSALDTTSPIPPAGDTSTKGGGQSSLGAPITPGGYYPTEATPDKKPSPDPWTGLYVNPADNSDVAISPTTSKTGQ